MTKKDWIQRAVLFYHLKPSEGRSAIDWAEDQWQKLSARGYGHKASAPTDLNKDWYKELSSDAKDRFMLFWKAFAKTDNRNGAAMRWYQMELNGINDKELEQIVYAAKKEAEARIHRPEGSVAKMGQGWLNEMRWKDVEVPSKKVQAADDMAQARKELIAEIAHYKNLHKINGDDFSKSEVERLETKLKACK